MSKTSSLTLKANENEVMDGINSILNMLELIDQPIFPRNVMCASYNGFFPVNSLKQMYNVFERSNFQDCRISAYPPVSENTMLIPNLLLLDIDYNDDQVKVNGIGYADMLNKTLINKILKRLQTKFEIDNFLVMKTGNGRHIIIPFLFDSPFEHVQEMQEILPHLKSSSHRRANNTISESFLPFAKKYFSNDQADKSNYPNFTSIFLRVPGSINMKMKYGFASIVKTEYEWKYERNLIPNFGDFHPKTDLFYDFSRHLCLIAGQHHVRKFAQSSLKNNSSKIKFRWIESLHDTAVSDCRKRILWLILAPYAINVRKMTSQNAFIWIKQWADKCNQAYQFEPGYNIDQKIDYYISVAEDNGHFPIAFNKLNSPDWKMKGGIDLSDLILRKM